MQVLRTDNGTEYVNNAFKDFLSKCGMLHETTVDGTPQQNGVAERANRTILEMVRCLLYDLNMDLRYWGEAAKCAVYIRNRSPSSALNGRLPEEVCVLHNKGSRFQDYLVNLFPCYFIYFHKVIITKKKLLKS